MGLGANGVQLQRGEHGLVYCGLYEAGDKRQHFEERCREWKPGRGI